ncbi:MAG TPA: type VII secretion target [Candidatus Limnocylindrales bacterium]|nr:type VII secretion target [Candidatus Limnocylindrales bacterium]
MDPEAMRAAARSYATTAEHLRIAADYHGQSSRLDFTDKGMILELKNTHDVFVALFQERLEDAAANLLESAAELEKAAVVYANTDLDAASRFDAALSVAVNLEIGGDSGGR